MVYPFIESESELSRVSSMLHQVVDPCSRLPEWPFVPVDGEVDVTVDSRFSGDDFVVVLGEIARVHGDDNVYFVTLDGSDMKPCFGLSVEEIPDLYQSTLGESIDILNGGCLITAVFLFAIFGDSLKWAVLVDKYWEFLFVYSPEKRRSWRGVIDIPFMSAADAVEFLWPDLDRSCPEEEIQRFINVIDIPSFRSKKK